MRLSDNKAVAVASFLHTNSNDSSIGVGNINYPPPQTKTRDDTNAIYLTMKWGLERESKRYETYFSGENSNIDRKSKLSLLERKKPALHKLDNKEFS